MKLKILISFFFLIFISNIVAANEWKAKMDKSHLFFVFSQAGTDEQGEFKSFTSELVFDPKKLADSKLKVVVGVASLDTGDKDRDEILFSKDMFNHKRWPYAYFETTGIRHIKDNQYLAKANLKIRDISKEVDFPFSLDIKTESGFDTFHLKSSLTISRLDFGVGQGDWAEDEWVANPVQVKVDLYAGKISK